MNGSRNTRNEGIFDFPSLDFGPIKMYIITIVTIA